MAFNNSLNLTWKLRNLKIQLSYVDSNERRVTGITYSGILRAHTSDPESGWLRILAKRTKRKCTYNFAKEPSRGSSHDCLIARSPPVSPVSTFTNKINNSYLSNIIFISLVGILSFRYLIRSKINYLIEFIIKQLIEYLSFYFDSLYYSKLNNALFITTHQHF